ITLVPQGKLGVRCLSANDVFFDDVKVPPSAVLGEVGKGWKTLATTLNTERITVAAECLGGAQAALDTAVRYAKEREAFGRPIGTYQALQHKLADSYVEMESARLLMLKAASLDDQGLPCQFEATAAKLTASEAAFNVATRGMDVMAGAGFMLEH